MNFSHVLWDFNGTLFDDMDACIESVNLLLRRRKMPTVDSVEQYYRLIGFPIIEYYKRLGFDLENESYDDIAVEWVTEYNRISAKAGLCRGALAVLSQIKEQKIPQLVLSATEQHMLERQLSQLGIDSFFDEIIGTDSIRGAGKLGVGREWIDRTHPQNAVLFGDMVHDFETASAMGIQCVLIANGHQSRESLECCGCTVIDSIEEAPRLLSSAPCNIFDSLDTST